MKAGNPRLMEVLKVLGTGKIGYIVSVTLRLTNGTRICASSTSIDGFMISGVVNGSDIAFMMPAEELVAIEVEWGALPEGVTDIPSAIEDQKKAGRK